MGDKEAKQLQAILDKTEMSKTELAAEIKIARRTLYYWLDGGEIRSELQKEKIEEVAKKYLQKEKKQLFNKRKRK